MHKIKKYANRRMYDSTDKKYVSMEDIAALVKDGQAVSIIDSTTGEDLTVAVLTQLLATETPDEGDLSPQGLIADLLRKGGETISGLAEKSNVFWRSALDTAEDEFDKLVDAFVKEREASKAEGRSFRAEVTGYAESLRNWINANVDARINEVLAKTHLATRDEIEALNDKVDLLTEQVDELQKALSREPSSEAQPAAE